jgi:Golgin subfamily A member 7/ERF4 family
MSLKGGDDPLQTQQVFTSSNHGTGDAVHSSISGNQLNGQMNELQQRSSRRPSDGPRSSYYYGPPSKNSAFGTPPVGVIGRDKPREIVRIERDYTVGELCQFHPTFPLELEGRISPTLYSETINDLNVIIIKANDPIWACLDNTLAVLTLYISPFILGSKYKRETRNLRERINQANKKDFNPVGLNLRYPSDTAFLFLELEYY